MALVVEDGSIVAGANSYASSVEYLDWSDARFGLTRLGRPETASDADMIVLRAMDYLETLSFKGSKASSGQSLQWPRDGVVIDGYTVSSSEIPYSLKVALFELAYSEEIGAGLMSIQERKTKKEKVDSIEVEYFESASGSDYNKAVSATLAKLLDSSGFGGNNFAVSRV